MTRSKYYFISDIHLGIPSWDKSLEREKKFVRWLDFVKQDAKEIFLLGDIFDFWFEYKDVVPKGYVRLLGKLAELSDLGIVINYFIGNHDQWVEDYFQKEIGIHVFDKERIFKIEGKSFFIAHGDGIDKTDKKYLFLKKIFTNPLLRKLFGVLHPRFAFWIARKWSKNSRLSHSDYDIMDKGDKEPLIQFCKSKLRQEDIDFFILGHRHLSTDYDLGNNKRYINLGQWVSQSNYAVFENENLEFKKFE